MDTLIGKTLRSNYCEGAFDEWDEWTIEAIGNDWIVVRGERTGPAMCVFRDDGGYLSLQNMDNLIEGWIEGHVS